MENLKVIVISFLVAGFLVNFAPSVGYSDPDAASAMSDDARTAAQDTQNSQSSQPVTSGLFSGYRDPFPPSQFHEPTEATSTVPQSPNQSETAAPPTSAPAIISVVHRTPTVVAEEIFLSDPTARVFTPEENADALVRDHNQAAVKLAQIENQAEARAPPQGAGLDEVQEGDIEPQKADEVNTILIAVNYMWDGIVYFVYPYSALQRLAMNGTNYLMAKKMDMQMGRWSQIVQWGGIVSGGAVQQVNKFADRQLKEPNRFLVSEPLTTLNLSGRTLSPDHKSGVEEGLTLLKAISQTKWQRRAERLGNLMTHTGMFYAYTAAINIAEYLHEGGWWHGLQQGIASWQAQSAVGLEAGAMVLSNIGWAMLARRMDAMPDQAQRPLSRPAFNAFETVQEFTVGLFVPFLLTMPHDLLSLSPHQWVVQVLPRLAPFLISGVFSGVAFRWMSPNLLKNFPRLKEALERFDYFTKRMNDKAIEGRAWILERLRDKKKRVCQFVMDIM